MSDNININLLDTEEVTSSLGNNLFAQGYILRKVSRFVTGSSHDTIISIPVYYDVISGEVCKEAMSPDLRRLFENKEEE
jgi:hypothetical protein